MTGNRVLLSVLFFATSAVCAEEPVAHWRTTVDLGRDGGQPFGSLFEARDAKGRLVAGAGFEEVYNTRFRSNRHTVQFFVRPAKGGDRFRIERLPHPDMDLSLIHISEPTSPY